MIDELARLGEVLSRPASLARLHGEPTNQFASHLGGVSVLGAGEAWPSYRGEPMVGVVQVNLSECPFVPMELRDVDLLCLWIAADRGDDLIAPDWRPNGDGWTVRAYRRSDVRPAVGPSLYQMRPHGVEWLAIDDLPAEGRAACP